MADLSNADRIALLAGSIEDYLPGPWMGSMRSRAGEGPSQRRKCKPCQGEGTVNTRTGTTVCAACAGRGVVLVDGYTGRVVAKVAGDGFELADGEIAATLKGEGRDYDSRKSRQRRIDGLLERSGDGEDWVDRVLRAKRAQYRKGDYARLEREAARLSELAEAAFWSVYGPGALERTPGPRLEKLALIALGLLDVRMPRARVPAELLSQRNRDQEIWYLAVVKELKQVQIAQRVGVSEATVSRVLKGRLVA